MSYSHKTTHSFSPDLEFWKSIENFVETFPYKQGKTGFLTSDEFIKYYERKYNESFDVDYSDTDVYGKSLSREFIWNPNQRSYLDEMDSMHRNMINPSKIKRKLNPTGLVVKFLSNSISNPDKVYKFQHFFESSYYYLIDILNLNPESPVIRGHGLDDQNNSQFQIRWERFKNANGGLMKATKFIYEFNKICRIHNTPFAMFIFNDNCYIIHTTDIFIEKLIQDIPLFLTDPNLQEANKFFIKAYTLRDEGKHKDCLAKVREGIEAVRDYIYTCYNLTKSTSVHNDFKELFNTHSTSVFDFTKIPEDNSDKLNKIVGHIRESVLVAVKIGNFGHHTLTRPHLLEENTSIFTLGLISSILPYMIYLLK